MSSDTQLPPSSLIICSRNRPQLLRDTIDSLLEGQDVPSELILIDQSDTPNNDLMTLQTDRPCVIRYCWTHSRGLCRAKNEGIALAQYEVLAITDDDMIAPVEWYGALIGALVRHGPQTVITGRVLTTAPEARGNFAPSLVLSEAPALYVGRIDTDVLASGNMAMYRDVVKHIGWFDERLGAGSIFPAADDNDFGFRLLAAGYQIAYAPEAMLYHRAWRTDDLYAPLRWSYGRGKGGYYAKHFQLRDTYMLRRVIGDLGSRILQLPSHIVRDRRRAVGDMYYIAGVCSGLTDWVRLARSRPAWVSQQPLDS